MPAASEPRPSGDYREFRPRLLRLVTIPLAIVVLVGFAVLSVALELAVDWPSWRAWDIVWMNALGAALCGAGLRAGSIKATPTAAGLVVRNFFRTTTIEWSAMIGASFNIAAGDPWVSLDLVDGSSHPVMAIAASDAAEAPAELARLRRLIAAHELP